MAGYLEQGQRLENLSWRLWHLQNLMVDTDNAKSKREFKKLSKSMGDKLDKEKGRSVVSVAIILLLLKISVFLCMPLCLFLSYPCSLFFLAPMHTITSPVRWPYHPALERFLRL